MSVGKGKAAGSDSVSGSGSGLKLRCGYCGKKEPEVLVIGPKVLPRADGSPSGMADIIFGCGSCGSILGIAVIPMPRAADSSSSRIIMVH